MKAHHSARGILAIVIVLGLEIVLLLVSLSLYTFRTIDIPAKGMIDIVSPNSYIDNGLFAQVPYMKYTFVPTKATKPDTTYRIVVGNGVVTREDKVSWTPLELEILKHKPIKYKLSQDEYSAIQRRSSFTMTASEIRSERNGNYLFIPVLYGCFFALGVMLWKERKPQPVPRPRYATSVKTQSPTPLSDEQQAKRCLQCPSIRMVNGALRCRREACNYKEVPIPVTPQRRTANHTSLGQLAPRYLPALSQIGAIPQVFIVGILTAFVGVGSLIFFAQVSQGAVTYQEPDKVILWGEIAFAAFLTLGGVIMTIIKLREVK